MLLFKILIILHKAELLDRNTWKHLATCKVLNMDTWTDGLVSFF